VCFHVFSCVIGCINGIWGVVGSYKDCGFFVVLFRKAAGRICIKCLFYKADRFEHGTTALKVVCKEISDYAGFML